MQSGIKKNKSPKRSKESNDHEARLYPSMISWSDEDQCFVAMVPALQGCMSHGATAEEAARNIFDAASGWLETAKQQGLLIPPPPQGLSGRLLVRIPKSLHDNIAQRAQLDGVSINHWVVAAIARAAGAAGSK